MGPPNSPPDDSIFQQGPRRHHPDRMNQEHEGEAELEITQSNQGMDTTTAEYELNTRNSTMKINPRRMKPVNFGKGANIKKLPHNPKVRSYRNQGTNKSNRNSLNQEMLLLNIILAYSFIQSFA